MSAFNEGDRVLVLLHVPIPGEPLRAKFCGPYTIDRKVSGVDYIVCTPDRRKKRRMCMFVCPLYIHQIGERKGDSVM